MSILSIIDPKFIISAFGTLGVIAIIFMETGFFFGFFFPGDSLLFTAGFFASQGYLPLGWLFLGVFIAAVLGDNVGYAFGRRVGPALFTRENSAFFNKQHIVRAQHFYEKHGVKTIILARFIPVVRTFAPIVAGIGTMPYRKFFSFNVIGGFFWAALVIGLGYGFGNLIPPEQADRYLLPVIGLIIVISALPALREIYRGWKHRNAA
jgi:membrane-associated protein